ncbi:MAG: TolC family protein [Bacteroidales bacterium]|nr:TolC family protein [Bacteroidales bacterium]MCF8458467.1 TolC family protein [Bacteroidales bacterium]
MKVSLNLKSIVGLTYLIWFALSFSMAAYGQEEDMKQLKASDFDPLKIGQESIFGDEYFYFPPLAILIDSALVHSPILMQFDGELEISRIELERKKREWTDYLYTTSEIKYGSTDNVTFNQNQTDPTINAVVTTRANIGLALRISAFDLTDRKRKIAIADEQNKISQARREEMVRFITKEVTLLYNDLLLSQRILTIKSETQQAKILHFNMAEKQFLEGELPVSEYAKIIEMIAKSSSEFETAKMDFTNAYFLLETAVGFDLQEIKKLGE